MKNILIIGGCGFIGKNIADDFSHRDYRIVVLDKNNFKDPDQPDTDNIKYIRGSLKDRDNIISILDEFQINIVIHLASILIPASSHEDFMKELSEIIIPTFELLPVLGRKKILTVFFSSGGTIYGKADTNIPEDHTLVPINYYGYSKLMIENHIRLMHEINDCPYLILRFSNVYGRYQRMNSQQGFISVALGRILEGKPVEIWGNGKTIRDYINVKDVTYVLEQLLNAGIINNTLNVASGKGTSLNEIIRMFSVIMDREIDVIYKPKRDVDLDKVILDITRLKSMIDYRPLRLEEGLRDYISLLSST